MIDPEANQPIAGVMATQETALYLESELRALEIVPIGEDLPLNDAERKTEVTVSEMRRRRIPSADDGTGILTLLETDGVLTWEEGPVTTATMRARGYRAGRPDGKVVTQLKFAKRLGVSEVAKQLALFDHKLTPNGPAALLQLDPEFRLRQVDEPPKSGKVLLLVHGAFSNSENLLAELKSTTQGQSLLNAAQKKYEAIIAFDHFTVSRSPYLNAIELNRFFRDSKAEADVICHSRGGLVVRWWTEYIDRPNRTRRVILVGSPSQGTSLADPTSLKEGINFLTNVGRVLGTGAVLIPFLTVAGGLLQIVASVSSFVSKAPLIDAALAMTPGLSAMSRIDNNFELSALNVREPDRGTMYYAVLSDFEPEDVSLWRFWSVFSTRNVGNAIGDRLVFKQPNDLVVDTISMSHHVFGDTPDLTDNSRFCVFGKDDHVHHCGYFRDERAIRFIANRFELQLGTPQ